MRDRHYHIERRLTAYLPTGIALLSLIVAGAAYFNSINEQEREGMRKEMLITPALTFIRGDYENELSISVENDGFGPAIIDNVVVQIDQECFDQANYNSYSDWMAAYRNEVFAAFKKLVEGRVNPLSESLDTNPIKRTEIVSHPQDESSNTHIESFDVVVDVYGTTVITLDSSSLSPGQIIQSGKKMVAFKSKVLNEEVSKEIRSSSGTPLPSPPIPVPHDETSVLSLNRKSADALATVFEQINVAVGYCSFSGQTCSISATSGTNDSKCFDRLMRE